MVSESNARTTSTAEAPPSEVYLLHPRDRTKLSNPERSKERFTSTRISIGLSEGDPEDTQEKQRI
jgi:hypothetical protein